MFSTFLFYYGLPLYNKTNELVNTLYNYINEIYNNIIFGLNSNVLLFDAHHDYPHFEYFFNKSTNDINLWKYDRYQKLFYNYNCSAKDTKRFPLLAASIGTMKDGVFIRHTDLDEFIDTVRIESSNYGYPNLNQFIYAYMYTNKMYLNKSMNFYIEYLDLSADQHIKKLFVEDFDFCSEKK